MQDEFHSASFSHSYKQVTRLCCRISLDFVGFRQNSSSCSRWNCSADGGSTNHCEKLRTSKAKSSGVQKRNCSPGKSFASSSGGLCCVFPRIAGPWQQILAWAGWHSWDRKVLPKVFWERQCKSLFHLNAFQRGIVLFSC